MLDACAELMDEIGYDGLTTTLLAERAGVAIGSVYQFFPDKRAIVLALAQRNIESYVERLSGKITSGELSHWWDAVDAAMDEFIDMNRSTPGFRTLRFGDVVDRNLLDADRDNDTVLTEQLGKVLVGAFGVPENDRLLFSLAIAVEMADGLIKLAFRRDPDGDDQVLSEAKKIVKEYLLRKVGSDTH